MNVAERFMAYAGDFERTFEDDDWARILPHFAEDAVYEVDSGAFGSKMKGPEAITRGLKKSLDGFDRRFETRTIEVIGEPAVEGDEMRMRWKVTYTVPGCEPYLLEGRSTVRARDGLIAYLADHYDAAADEYLERWKAENSLAIDPSYT
jgi:hypothetical protein